LPGTDRLLPNFAFFGKAGAGKSTAADLLIKRYGYRRLSFAAVLKDVAALIWGTGARTDRDKLQRLGMAVREIDADAWVNAALFDLFGETWAVDDLRFPNEYYALRAEDFVFVRVVAGRGHRITRLRANGKLQDEAQLDHASETALDAHPSDYVIVNESDEAELFEQLERIVERERKRRA
jgi:hypothetical protein